MRDDHRFRSATLDRWADIWYADYGAANTRVCLVVYTYVVCDEVGMNNYKIWILLVLAVGVAPASPEFSLSTPLHTLVTT